MIQFDFQDQTALVTGASRGIGEQIARDLLACGAKVIVTAPKQDAESALHHEFGTSVSSLVVDFSDGESTQNFLHEIDSQERIDVCVNNAGVLITGPITEIPESDWDMVHAINLKAPFLVTQAVAKLMKQNGYGRVVNIASIWDQITMPGRAAYASSKSGLRGLTRTSAVDLIKDGILVNAVSPGFTLTKILRDSRSPDQLQELAKSIPLGRLAETTEISHAALFLASRLNTYITGQTLTIDGGYSIV
uniref:Gluconate 5-dehydrogenase/3-oxoacyl-[acyl-carrier protein] reductase n=1 Tax=Candidatus Kentrum sp. MB TaxID=2138164 RepID=A0A450XM47_9GAMM|nr:MAG: gluconate 5-dehydrogenase/3-oxoacyl-[acyl-carrier protein] reductase [Candidatus Kentron sp. MB]VFK30382.1 MAG: gluconate 5-dehydrogenase/3-oxoacyl-[acyl-carrier protein] reductase [Candidatus Kentron sp. MB]VFK75195.1 MAG: gluconate 5-dehydrogenase/3-oxoacyl-[acyl-carrier protein] reductase [Candidatus Kentron sp. MB]